jgi:hypothetical protein
MEWVEGGGVAEFWRVNITGKHGGGGGGEWGGGGATAASETFIL